MKKYLLALDQATKITGYALFEDGKLIDNGIFCPKESNYLERISELRSWVIEKIGIYNSELQIGLEDIQLQNNLGSREENVVTFKKLAHVQGVLLEVLTTYNIPYDIVLASSWKHSCNIKGRNREEQKRNAMRFVEETYNIKTTQDSADAICIGTHILKNQKKSDFDWSD